MKFHKTAAITGAKLRQILTRDAVLDAIADFDAKGSIGFFQHHQIRYRAKSYFILLKGQEYDMQAIVRVARGLKGYQVHGPVNRPNEVAGWLKSLGFEIAHRKLHMT